MTVRKVYFNGACPVCNAGIARQRKRMMEEGVENAIEWCDINRHPTAVASRGVAIEDVRRKLYVEDERGGLHIGASAFAALWLQTARQRWLGRLVQMPVVSALARRGYDAFAAVLYAWNRRKGRW
jgi:predicted DCC family thiol-disulfide oxidoreductase YuxK